MAAGRAFLGIDRDLTRRACEECHGFLTLRDLRLQTFQRHRSFFCLYGGGQCIGGDTYFRHTGDGRCAALAANAPGIRDIFFVIRIRLQAERARLDVKVSTAVSDCGCFAAIVRIRHNRQHMIRCVDLHIL